MMSTCETFGRTGLRTPGRVFSLIRACGGRFPGGRAALVLGVLIGIGGLGGVPAWAQNEPANGADAVPGSLAALVADLGSPDIMKRERALQAIAEDRSITLAQLEAVLKSE